MIKEKETMNIHIYPDIKGNFNFGCEEKTINKTFYIEPTIPQNMKLLSL